MLTGLDYWLDNLMCNVPEVVMCFHLDGIVQVFFIFILCASFSTVVYGGDVATIVVVVVVATAVVIVVVAFAVVVAVVVVVAVAVVVAKTRC